MSPCLLFSYAFLFVSSLQSGAGAQVSPPSLNMPRSKARLVTAPCGTLRTRNGGLDIAVKAAP